ncbi:MAG: response regulator transcription factor [Chitinophagaceae bacterium]
MHRILIADDHQTIRQILKNILLDEFPLAHVEEADNTFTLIDKAFAGDWDLIISDLVMPGGGGLYALEQIKKKKPSIPILIVSTHPSDQYAKLVVAAGAEEFINKSNLPERLIPSIRRILQLPQHS